MEEIITTGLCSPCRGIIISGTGSVQDDDAHWRPCLRRKPTCGFGILFCKTCMNLKHVVLRVMY